jgi:hypothetical protein
MSLLYRIASVFLTAKYFLAAVWQIVTSLCTIQIRCEMMLLAACVMADIIDIMHTHLEPISSQYLVQRPFSLPNTF